MKGTSSDKRIIPEDYFLCVLIFLISFFIRIPFYRTPFWRSPDAIEYINVAENLNRGWGLTQSIKWHFFDDSLVITNALRGKPILTSLVLSPFLKLKDDPYSLQLLIFITVSFSVVFFFLLCRQYFSSKVSFIGSLLLALNPNILITNRMILSENLFLFWVILVGLVYLRAVNSLRKLFLVGFLIGLAFLTRFEGVLFLPILLFSKKKKLPQFLLILGGFLSVTLPYFYLNYQMNRNPFFSYNINHYRVFLFSEGMSQGFNKIFPTPFEFIRFNFPRLLPLILGRFLENLKAFVNPGFFGPLAFCFAAFRRKTLKKFNFLLAWALMVLILFSLTWSAFQEPERHLIPVFLVLLLPLLTLLSEKPNLIIKSLFVITFIVYFVLDLHRIDWARNQEVKLDFWNQKRREALGNWFKKNSSESTIIASQNPWLVYLATKRPTILLPDNLFEKDNFNLFKNQYQVGYLVIEGLNPKIELKPIFTAEDFSIFKIK